MAKNRREKQWFESAGALILGRTRTRRRARGFSDLLFTRRGLVLWALILATGCALWLVLGDGFYVQKVDVTGTVRLSPTDVIQASDLLGLHILWARPAAVEKQLLAALPSLQSAKATCKWRPATCQIIVSERNPRVMWEEEGGGVWWIDAQGVIFPAADAVSGEDAALAVDGSETPWVVQGPLPRDDAGRLDRRVRDALSELWDNGGDVATFFYYVPGRGLTFVNEHGWQVFVGQGSGMEKRLQVLDLLTDSLLERGVTPRFVDVRFADAPYYSLTSD